MGIQFRLFIWSTFLAGTLLFLAAAIRERDPLLIPGTILFLVAELSAIVYLEFARERGEERGGD
jgi:hypothetical protein